MPSIGNKFAYYSAKFTITLDRDCYIYFQYWSMNSINAYMTINDKTACTLTNCCEWAIESGLTIIGHKNDIISGYPGTTEPAFGITLYELNWN